MMTNQELLLMLKDKQIDKLERMLRAREETIHELEKRLAEKENDNGDKSAIRK